LNIVAVRMSTPFTTASLLKRDEGGRTLNHHRVFRTLLNLSLPRRAFLPCILAAILFVPLRKSEAQVGGREASLQAAMIFKILPYDRKLAERAGKAINIAILYKEGDSDSETAQKQLIESLNDLASKSNIKNLPVKTFGFAYTTPTKLQEELAKSGAGVVYVSSGLGDALSAISKVTQARSILSFTALESFVKDGISIGVVRRETKAAILVNLSSARAEGADLDSNFLKIAEVMR
jgi:hypothetical protein